MTFQPISDLSDSDAIKFLFFDYYAVDTERHLALSTTNGRTRNARRWFVTRYDLPSGRTDWQAGKVIFREWTANEAIQQVNSSTRLQNRIAKVFDVKAVSSCQ